MTKARANALRYIGPAVVVGALIAGAAIGAQTVSKPKAAAVAARTPAANSALPTARLPGYSADRNAYYGDLHVHTYLSNDAYIFNVRRTPEDAYRFAQGEVIGHAVGFQIRLAGGPLDFTAVTDHAEYLAAVREGGNPDNPDSKLPISQELISSDPVQIGKAFTAFYAAMRAKTLPQSFTDPATGSRAWAEVREAAERHNRPGRFTTFVGYEYTASSEGRNLHRNVIFRGTKVPDAPYSAINSPDPEDLWRTMDGWRAKGIEALAIPHNSNGSDGIMFDTVRLNGQAVDRAYADLRMRNEPLVEMTQIKGTSETHPTLSPNDEWANFELMENYIGSARKVTKFKGGYVRQALQDGILMRQAQGFNPFKFGLIGASDTHNAAPGSVEEPNYFSKTGRTDGMPALRGSAPPNKAADWEGAPVDPPGSPTRPASKAWGASGLAGVWAEENSREAIYAAMRRKETFATSGPRIKVRFFAGYDFPADLLTRTDTVRQAYVHGVPMGGDLLSAADKAPKFLVWAVRDPTSGFLQRAQVVKGWIENGVAREQVFDVACADGLAAANGRCPANGATVDLKTCQPDRFKGDVELRTVWSDPTFNPRQRAFYYVRVLENPSCRWSTWDALRNGTPRNPLLQPTVMERAWSSPIWFEPTA